MDDGPWPGTPLDGDEILSQIRRAQRYIPPYHPFQWPLHLTALLDDPHQPLQHSSSSHGPQTWHCGRLFYRSISTTVYMISTAQHQTQENPITAFLDDPYQPLQHRSSSHGPQTWLCGRLSYRSISTTVYMI